MPGSGRSYASADSLGRTFVFIEVEDETFDWWSEYQVSSHILNAADQFSFRAPAMARAPNQLPEFDARMLKRGQRVRIYLKTPQADRPVLQHTAIIDSVDMDESVDGATVVASGRDHLAPIVDSHIMPSIGLEKISFAEVAKRLLTERMPGQPAPFFAPHELVIDNEANRLLLTGKPASGGFSKALLDQASQVAATTAKPTAKKVANAVNKTIAQVQPHAGESVYEYLNRHARRFGLLIWGTCDGKVVIGRPNYEQKPLYDLTLRQGLRGVENTVQSFRWHRSFTHRPSEIHVYGRSDGGDEFRSKIHAIVHDEEVRDAGLWRAVTIKDPNARTREQAVSRANYELSMRRQTGDVLTATVVGHASTNGAVYAVDTIASVVWDKAEIADDRYVVGRTFTRSRVNGTHTQLQLLPKGAITLGDGED